MKRIVGICKYEEFELGSFVSLSWELSPRDPVTASTAPCTLLKKEVSAPTDEVDLFAPPRDLDGLLADRCLPIVAVAFASLGGLEMGLLGGSDGTAVEVGSGCGATLESSLAPPTVGSQPLVGALSEYSCKGSSGVVTSWL